MSSPAPPERTASPYRKGEKATNPVLDAEIMATKLARCKANKDPIRTARSRIAPSGRCRVRSGPFSGESLPYLEKGIRTHGLSTGECPLTLPETLDIF